MNKIRNFTQKRDFILLYGPKSVKFGHLYFFTLMTWSEDDMQQTSLRLVVIVFLYL